MNLSKEQVKILFKLFYSCCNESCATYQYNGDYDEDNRDPLCNLCCSNKLQFYVPKDDFVNKINKMLEEK